MFHQFQIFVNFFQTSSCLIGLDNNIESTELSHMTIFQDRLWRKNRYPTPGSPCVGIDSNRNFGFNWGGEGSSGDPCSTTYRGSAPFSEAESSAVRDALSANSGRVKAFISVHSYASLWMTPFGHTSELPPDYDEMVFTLNLTVK